MGQSPELIHKCLTLQALLPLVTIVPAVISRVSGLLGFEFSAFWTDYFLVIAAFVPWLSVVNPLITILYVERYRQFVAKRFRSSIFLFGRNAIAIANANLNVPQNTQIGPELQPKKIAVVGGYMAGVP